MSKIIHFKEFSFYFTVVMILFGFSGKITTKSHCNRTGCYFCNAGNNNNMCGIHSATKTCCQGKRNSESIAHADHYMKIEHW